MFLFRSALVFFHRNINDLLFLMLSFDIPTEVLRLQEASQQGMKGKDYDGARGKYRRLSGSIRMLNSDDSPAENS